MGKKKTENEFIAEFMGFKSQKTSYGIVYSHPDLMGIYGVTSGQKFKYDTSWDWLMPVVEKIEGLYRSAFPDNFTELILRKQRPIDIHYMDVLSLPMGTKIEEVYKAVVEFINWYNTNVKK